MSDDVASPARSRRVLQLVDALYYALGILLACLLLATGLGYGFGAGLVSVKFWLFVFGIFGFGIGAIQLRPTPAWRDEPRFSIEPDGETAFQAAIQRVPPLRGHPLPPDQRLSVGARLFLGSLLTLATSFLMEVVFGVGVPSP
jgi:hypothetical protein